MNRHEWTTWNPSRWVEIRMNLNNFHHNPDRFRQTKHGFLLLIYRSFDPVFNLPFESWNPQRSAYDLETKNITETWGEAEKKPGNIFLNLFFLMNKIQLLPSSNLQTECSNIELSETVTGPALWAHHPSYFFCENCKN